MTLYGYDGSDFTRVMNFDGLSFVTHKATEHAPDEVYYHFFFGPVMEEARNKGVPFLGAYVVPRTGVPAGTQAQTAIDFVHQEASWLFSYSGFFWQVDLERWPYDSTDASVGKTLADELHVRTGKPVVIYASKGQYDDSVPQGYPLWNANYNGSGSGDFRQQYQNAGGDNNPAWGAYSGQVPVILQYSSDSVFADGNTGDANAFRGSVADFAAMLGSSVPVAQPPAPTPAPGGSVPSLRILDGVQMDSVGNKLKTYYERVLPADLISRLYITSNFRPSDGNSYHGDTGSNGALDVAGPMTDQGQRDMRDASEILIRDHDLFLEMIHTTPFSTDNGYYVKNGNVVGETYYGNEVPLHLDHIHIASSESMCDELLRRHPAPVSPPPAPVPVPIPAPTPVPAPGTDLTGVLAEIDRIKVTLDVLATAISGNIAGDVQRQAHLENIDGQLANLEAMRQAIKNLLVVLAK